MNVAFSRVVKIPTVIRSSAVSAVYGLLHSLSSFAYACKQRNEMVALIIICYLLTRA